jgi:uncharacterized protein (TIGR03083 family)
VTAANDRLSQLSLALDQTGAVISRVRPDQAELPTPCRSWDVRSLVNHVVHDVRLFTAAVTGEPRPQGEGDLIGDDWSGAYRQAADGLLAAWNREGALDEDGGSAFGPEVAVSADAPIYDRLAAFFGRDPR